MWQQRLAECRQLHPGRMSQKELYAELIFEFAQRSADRWLRQRQCGGGRADAAQPRNMQERIKLAMVQSHAQLLWL